MSSSSALQRLRRWLSGNGSAGDTATATPGPHAGGLRQQRAVRREQLFTLVRENMIRMGVLSSHYKFKVLTLDAGGEQFIVMVDWQPGALGADPVFEKQFEAGLQHLLVERLQGFKVKAVYWRGHAEGAAPALARAERPNLAVHHEEHVSEVELRALQAALREAGSGAAATAAHLAPVNAPTAAPTSLQSAHRPSRAAPQQKSLRAAPSAFPDFEPTVNTEGHQGSDFGSLSATQYDKLS